MRQSSPVSPRLRPRSPVVRCTPSRVSTVSPGRARRTREAASGQERQVVGVGGLAELEHDVVRGVDDVVDRAHAGQQQALGDPARRRGDGDVAQDGNREPGAKVGRLHRRARRLLHRPAAGGRRRRFGQRERQLQAAGQIAGDPRNAPGVGTVALDRNVEDGVDPQPERLHDRRPRLARRLVAQDQQARAVVGETELLARAQHAVGRDAAQLALADLEAARAGWPRPAPAAPGPPPRSWWRRTRSRAAPPRPRRRWSGGFCRRP